MTTASDVSIDLQNQLIIMRLRISKLCVKGYMRLGVFAQSGVTHFYTNQNTAQKPPWQLPATKNYKNSFEDEEYLSRYPSMLTKC